MHILVGHNNAFMYACHKIKNISCTLPNCCRIDIFRPIYHAASRFMTTLQMFGSSRNSNNDNNQRLPATNISCDATLI